MSRIVTIIFYAIVVIALIYGIGYLIWFGGDSYQGSGFSLTLTYVLAGIALLAALGTSVIGIIHHPKSGIKSLIGIAGIVLIAIIGFASSPGEILPKYTEFGVETEQMSKIVDAGMYLLYGSIGVAVIAIIISEFSALFKN